MEKKYKYVVVDNETTEVISEFDANIIIAGINLEDGVNISSAVHGTSMDLAQVIFHIEKHIAELKQSYPEVDLMLQFLHYKNKNGGENDE